MLIKGKTPKKITEGSILSPAGFKVAGLHSGVKRKRKDLGLIYCDVPASAAGVFTTNKVQAAPLQVTKDALAQDGKLQAIIVNSGNANAFTGEQGLQDAEAMQDVTAERLEIPTYYTAVASTGIIGLPLEMDKIIPHIDPLVATVDKGTADDFNESILTTDTSYKSTCYEIEINGKTITMGGSAKGSGMIEPNMATMLGFITTDLNIQPEHLQAALSEVTNKTFNCITVDGDTSTNDTVLVMASGLAGNESLTPTDEDWPLFITLLNQTCEDLAKMIAKDGEGATKLIEVEVNGARTDEEALQAAKAVVGSSLVKTAVYGADANWGRIVSAVGYSGAAMDQNNISMAIGSVKLLENSEILSYSEEDATAILEEDIVKISVNLHLGTGTGKAWGCDLTYDYVKINASYRS